MTAKILAIALIALPNTLAQQSPAFEVASIKLSTAGDYLSVNTDGGMARYTHLTLRMLIAIANKIDNVHVAGGPSWLDNQYYEIAAKLPEGAGKDQIPAMLDRLLQERFKVVVHRESKEQKVLALTVTQNGPKLVKSDDAGGGNGTIRPDGMKVRGVTMAVLARMLKRPAGADVVDRTGITGIYDIEMTWRKDENSDGPDFFTALQEQFGLKLEPSRAPVEVLVVDGAERIPIEN
jgi:uncharacterized protein (TIGR03435 family)